MLTFFLLKKRFLKTNICLPFSFWKNAYLFVFVFEKKLLTLPFAYSFFLLFFLKKGWPFFEKKVLKQTNIGLPFLFFLKKMLTFLFLKKNCLPYHLLNFFLFSFWKNAHLFLFLLEKKLLTFFLNAYLFVFWKKLVTFLLKKTGYLS